MTLSVRHVTTRQNLPEPSREGRDSHDEFQREIQRDCHATVALKIQRDSRPEIQRDSDAEFRRKIQRDCHAERPGPGASRALSPCTPSRPPAEGIRTHTHFQQGLGLESQSPARLDA